jgi:hypothetical protein
MQTIFAKAETGNEPGAEPSFTPPYNGTTPENSTSNRALVDALTNSRTYREYERAFGDMTGLPIALQPVETWQLPHHGKRNENDFCSLLSQKSRACAVCL